MKNFYISELHSFFVYIGIIFVISLLILSLCYIFTSVFMNHYFEKSSGYECGFDPFSDAREPFHVRFYLVSILFILFDSEIIFLFPYITSIEVIGINGHLSLLFFVIILLIGYAYEWKKNSLDWS